MGGPHHDGALWLPLPERIEVVRGERRGAAAEAYAVPVASVQRAELESQFAALEAMPGAERPWYEVLTRGERQ